jgi:hypothetical protein
VFNLSFNAPAFEALQSEFFLGHGNPGLSHLEVRLRAIKFSLRCMAAIAQLTQLLQIRLSQLEFCLCGLQRSHKLRPLARDLQSLLQNTRVQLSDDLSFGHSRSLLDVDFGQHPWLTDRQFNLSVGLREPLNPVVRSSNSLEQAHSDDGQGKRPGSSPGYATGLGIE